MVQHKSRHVNQWNRIGGRSDRSAQLWSAAALTKGPETDDKMTASSEEGAKKT